MRRTGAAKIELKRSGLTSARLAIALLGGVSMLAIDVAAVHADAPEVAEFVRTAPPVIKDLPQDPLPVVTSPPALPVEPVPETAAQLAQDPATPVPVAPGQVAQVRDINPFDRDIELTVPMTFNRRTLGELPVLLTRDDRFVVQTQPFIDLLQPLLNDQGKADLATALAGRDGFEAQDLAATGIVLDYDPNALSILVLRIDPSKRTVESVFYAGEAEEPGLPPATVSAYLNSTVVGFYRSNTAPGQSATPTPSVFLNGAARYGSTVFEFDFQGREDQFTQDYEFIRRYARLVYDQPEQFRRFSLGDLETETRGRQGFVNMGGLGVVRQTRRFNSFRPGLLSGDRQVLLQSDSTVRVLRNGVLVREFRLDAGQYDFTNLPLEIGSNDVQLQIVDDSGQSSVVSYRAYLDAIDLEPGDYEYGAYLGVVAPLAIGSPNYDDGDPAFTGYFRKAFVDRPAVGVGLQVSEAVQMVDGQTQFILPGGNRLQFNAAVSNADGIGTGYAAAVIYDVFINRGDQVDRASLQLDHVSREFATLGNTNGQNPIEFTFTAVYSRVFNDRLFGSVDASYQKGRDGFGDSYQASADLSYRVSDQFTLQGGISYTEFDQSTIARDNVGINIGLVWTPRYDTRMDARYESASDSGSVSFFQTGDGRVGSTNASALASYDRGAGSLSGSVGYVGNRFDANLAHAAFGRSFNSLTDQQVTSLALTSSVAYAGGKVALGRRIGDSFAILYPHETLGNRRVITGDDLDGGRYNASSGVLGPALDNALGSYVNQSLRYDVVDAPAGYDIGEGILRLRPTYKSGYAYEVGTDAYVSALGTLVGDGEVPLALVSGRLRPANEPDATPVPFFTNTVGRFAMQGLRPGVRYRVELLTDPRQTFEFEVPADSDGLLNLQRVQVAVPVNQGRSQ